MTKQEHERMTQKATTGLPSSGALDEKGQEPQAIADAEIRLLRILARLVVDGLRPEATR